MINNTSEVISTGNAFTLEKWDGKKWVKLSYSTNRIFTNIGYEIKPGDSKSLETDVSGYYPNLPKGKYRISKFYFYDKDIPITADEKHIIYTTLNIQ